MENRKNALRFGFKLETPTAAVLPMNNFGEIEIIFD
jgi:hypothetical protein